MFQILGKGISGFFLIFSGRVQKNMVFFPD